MSLNASLPTCAEAMQSEANQESEEIESTYTLCDVRMADGTECRELKSLPLSLGIFNKSPKKEPPLHALPHSKPCVCLYTHDDAQIRYTLRNYLRCIKDWVHKYCSEIVWSVWL